jgi:hypothetical protein
MKFGESLQGTCEPEAEHDIQAQNLQTSLFSLSINKEGHV